MSWVRVDDEAPSHPKIVQIGVAAFGFFCASLCYANRYLTDGFISVGALSAVFPGERWAMQMRLAERLVEAGLWEKKDDGWQIHDYLEYQGSKSQVLAERISTKTRVANWRRNTLRNAVTNGHVTPPVTEKYADEHPKEHPKEHPRELEALSGSRPTANGFHAESREILEWLNTKAGKRFEFIPTNLDPIKARLREGREVWQLKKVVSVKAKAWGTDEHMREYLRPATLFNKTKCAQYIGELPAEVIQ